MQSLAPLVAHNMAYQVAGQPRLRPLSFSLNPGEALSIEGDNGSGKTTLLKCLASLMLPNQGQLHYQGVPIEQQLTHYRPLVNFVGHRLGVHPYLTVEQQCQFESRSMMPSMQPLLNIMGLVPHRHRQIAQLSAGQQRKVALLRLWLKAAPIWVLDEPSVALDKSTQEIVMQKCQAHVLQGGMLCVSSHQPLNFGAVCPQRIRLCSH